MKDAPDVLNCVEACNMEGRLERLESMLGLLEQCEKALQDYLETKRIAFPRFYFVAPADLLDILSKGTNPQLILRHLSKCFDNIHNLSFTLDEKGNPSKTAISMWSGEKENVAFVDGGCICDGPVETWLGSVVDTMRAALLAEFKTSLPKYDEMPRQQWMFQQSAQNTITVSRMIFTQEINEAFDQLEEGNDNAIKDMWQKQVDQLAGIIEVVNGKLEKLRPQEGADAVYHRRARARYLPEAPGRARGCRDRVPVAVAAPLRRQREDGQAHDLRV